MSSDETTANTLKRRLRSSGEAFAEHTLETAKSAAKGLENTHAAYIYPLQAYQCHVQMTHNREFIISLLTRGFSSRSLDQWLRRC
jgi:hypothetical protein